MSDSNEQISVSRISDALTVKARLIPDRAAHDTGDRVLTFAEWDRRADEVAGGLAASGLEPGDRVFLAISMDHALEMAVAVIATMRAGGIACPVNTRLARAEFLEYADLLEPRFAITDTPDKTEHLSFERVWSATDMPADPDALPDQSAFDPEADAAIVGTSGTTGRPKGVVLSHPDLMSTVGDGTRFNERTNPALHSMPFTGYGGFVGQCVRPIMDGQTSLILYPFDTDRLIELIESKRPVSLMLVPTMLRLLLDHPAATTVDMSSVRLIVTGTAPLPHDSLKRAMALWPKVRINNAYAMSEGGFHTAATTPEQLAKPGCVGKLQPNMEIRDEQGNPVPSGVVGEIYGKAEGKSRRYWRDENTSRATWIDGWTKSGDLGYVDADGDLILTGRSKELIIRGGYNIAPVEIEDVLYEHPAVKDAAVVGISHEVLGEDVAAAVTLAAGATASSAELEDWCRRHLADNKVPRTIVILDELPLNQNAKVLKRDLLPILQRAADRARAERHKAE
jgi:long-chain acyl-CoA synthetase